MPTFGRLLAGAGAITINDHIAGGEFTCPDAGQKADSITVWLKQVSAVAANYKCMLYKASDNSLVGTTEERNILLPAGVSEQTFNFVTPPSIENENYIITVWSDDWRGNLSVQWTGVDTVRGDAEVYNGAPAIFADDEYEGNSEAAIYCTYSSAGGGSVSNVSLISLGLGAWLAIQKKKKRMKKSVLAKKIAREAMKPMVRYLKKVDEAIKKAV